MRYNESFTLPTLTLISLNVIAYLYTSALGRNLFVTSRSILEIFGQYNYAVLYGGSWWQLMTSMFVHVHIGHLVSNMFFLLIFGLRAESLFSDLEFYICYLTSGLVGNFLSLLIWPLSTISAGASGAIFGLFGAVISYMRSVVDRSMLGTLLFAFLFFVITISTDTNIIAHFGGLGTGLVIGILMARNRKLELANNG